MYQTLTNYTISGLDDIFLYFNVVTGGVFMPFFLYTFFAVLLLGICYSQQRRFGQVNFFTAFATSSFLSLILGILMRLKTGLLDNVNFGIVIGLAIISAGLLFFTQD